MDKKNILVGVGVGAEPDGHLGAAGDRGQEGGRDAGGTDGRHDEKPSCCRDDG